MRIYVENIEISSYIHRADGAASVNIPMKKHMKSFAIFIVFVLDWYFLYRPTHEYPPFP